jgi:hypothetical protein
MSMKSGEIATFVCDDSNLCYGAIGCPPYVPPNSGLEFDIEIHSVIKAADYNTFAGSGDASVPRTPAAIKAAFEQRKKIKAQEDMESGQDKRTGVLEMMIDRLQMSYFFGFFESDDDDNEEKKIVKKLPWFLTPSITFPIAFATVTATFWVLSSLGGITEKGAQPLDDLDVLVPIISSVLVDVPIPPTSIVPPLS